MKKKEKYCIGDARLIAKFLSILTLLFYLSTNVLAQLGGQAVVTNFSGDIVSGVLLDGPVVRIIDIHNPPITGANYNAPKRSEQLWNASVLGQVFGIAINPNTQDIFVTASSVYENYDYSNSPLAFGVGGSAGVYKINPTTGVVSTLVYTVPFGTPSIVLPPLVPPVILNFAATNVLGTNTLPNGSLTKAGPGLGNICFDKIHQRLFVTNFEDGKIYRIHPETGIIDNVYDPVAPANPGGTSNPAMAMDDVIEGLAPWGENIFGIGYNVAENRIYYGVCVKENWNQNTSQKNIIRSIGLDNNGKMNGVDRFEFAIDNYHDGSSGVISDITFNYLDNGTVEMAVAGKAVDDRMKSVAYSSNAELYVGYSENWNKYTTYTVGDDDDPNGVLNGTSCAGGIDFGYTTYNPNTFTNSGTGERIWMTSEKMLNDPNVGRQLFGIHSSPTSGNAGGLGYYKTVGHFVDIYVESTVVLGNDFSNNLGDVEIFDTESEVEINCTLTANAGEDEYICKGESIVIGEFPYVASGGQGPYTYEWKNVQGDIISTIEHPSVSPDDVTTYYVMVTDNNGCVAHDNVTIYVIQPPADQTICDGESIDVRPPKNPLPEQAVFTVTNPLTGQVYNISTGYGINPTSSTDYTWALTIDGKTCSGTFEVTVNPNPTADAGTFNFNDGLECAGEPYKLGGMPTADGGTPGYTYEWTASTGEYINPNNIANPTAYPYNPTIYEVLVTDANGCQDTDDVQVFVKPGPVAEAGQSQTICLGNGANIGSPALPGHVYAWRKYPNTAPFPTNESMQTVYPLETSTYKLTVMGPNGCRSIDYVTIRVNDITVDAGQDVILCNGSFTRLGGNPTALGGSFPYLYNWDNGAADIANPWVNPEIDTEYKVIVTDAYNCTGEDKVRVRVIGDKLTVDAGNDRTICSGVTTMLGSFPTAQGTGVYVYQWSVNGTLISVDPNPQVQPNYTTEYDLIVTDQATGCTASATVKVTVNQTPQITPPTDKEICSGGYTRLNVNATGSGNNYLWSPSTGLSCTNCRQPYASPMTTTNYCVEITSGNGCVPSQSIYCVRVTVNPSPVADAGPDKLLCEGKWVMVGGVPTATGGTPFTNSAGDPYYNYAWTDASGNAVFGNYSNPDFVTGPTNTYTVTVTDSEGCTDSDAATITTIPDVAYVGNSGFQDGIVPITRGQVAEEYTDGTWFTSGGTPDLFDARFTGCLNQLLQPACLLDPVDLNCMGIPCNHFGYQKHRLNFNGQSGRYAGLSAFISLGERNGVPPNPPVPNDLLYFCEGIEQELDVPLVAGEEYCVSLFGSLAENGELTAATVNDEAYFVVKMDDEAKYGGNTTLGGIPIILPLPSDADVIFTGSFDELTEWQYKDHYFTANKNYTHIIVESHFPESLFDKVQTLLGSAPSTGAVEEFVGIQSYFYIDDIEVHKVLCCSYDWKAQEATANDALILDENFVVEKLKLFPNPTSGELNIQLNTDSEEPAFVQVYSLDAKLVSERQAVNTTNSSITTINLSHLPQGIYYVELVQGEQIIRERIIVQ